MPEIIEDKERKYGKWNVNIVDLFSENVSPALADFEKL